MTDYRKKTSEYLTNHPNTQGTRQRIEDIGWYHPKHATKSKHSRDPRRGTHGIAERGVNDFQLKRTIQNGELMPSRPRYENRKAKKLNPRAPTVWKTDYGVPAGDSDKTCPILRLKDGTATVVLSACFPKEMNKDKFKPHVVTAYHSIGKTYPRWSEASGELRRRSKGSYKLESTSNFPSLGKPSSKISRGNAIVSGRTHVRNMSRQLANMRIGATRVNPGRGGGRGGRPAPWKST